MQLLQTGIKWIFTITIALYVAHSVQAATYHVSTNGSDSFDGSPGQPWRTIQRAANMMNAGDTALVSPGLYNERIVTKRHGTATNRITYRAPDGDVFCKGFVVVHDFITVDGFSMTNGYFYPTEYHGAIELDKTADECWMINNQIYDFEKTSGASNRFYCIYFQQSVTNAAGGPQNCIISNNVFRNTTYLQVFLSGSKCQVVNNIFDDPNGRDGLHVFGRGHRIANNIFTNFVEDEIIQDHCDIIQTFGDNVTESYDILFEKNLIINCSGAQLCQLEQKGKPDIRDWTFRNNVWINMGYAANVVIPGCKWINNTFYRCTRNTGNTLSFVDNWKGMATNGVILNNIFFECGSRPYSPDYGWYGTLSTNQLYTADYNFVCGTNFSAKGTNRFTEPNGVNGGDPRFRDPANYDFRLRPDSPLLNKAQSQSEFSDDIKGVIRPHGAGWEIGAYEFIEDLSSIAVGPSGTVLIQFLVEPSATHFLEASVNLTNWQAVATNTAGSNGLLHFEQVTGFSQPWRFYRITSP